MSETEFNPTDKLIVGTIGEPGNRTFFLQGRSAERLVTVRMEKQQVVALAQGAHQLLLQISHRREIAEMVKSIEEGTSQKGELPALEEDVPMWDVGEMEIGYDASQDLAVVSVGEFIPEEEERTASVARFWLTRPQLAGFASQAVKVVAQGRPICPFCGLPKDPSGHQCPASNGHAAGP